MHRFNLKKIALTIPLHIKIDLLEMFHFSFAILLEGVQ